MSQYEKLDEMIIDRLCTGEIVELVRLGGGARAIECERIAALTGREAFRVMDGRLQALRKKKQIQFVSIAGLRGWSLPFEAIKGDKQ